MAVPSQIVVLVEDRRHQNIIRRYLGLFGIEAHITRYKLPTSGSGEQWVRNQFPVEVAACRRRGSSVQTRLIVAMDADTSAIEIRIRQLDETLRTQGIERIGQGEQIARLIPKRNIETWILCLNGNAVDELRDYKQSHREWEPLIVPAARSLYAWTRPNAALPQSCTPSLRHDVAELSRLDLQ